MSSSSRPPTRDLAADEIERALVELRRSMTRRTLQRRHDPTAPPATAALFAVLDALEERPGASVGEMAEAVAVDQPRASRLVAQAVDQGWATRVADPRDGRRQQVHLTPAGRQVLAAAHETRRRAVLDALAGFDDADARRFASLLSAFVSRWGQPPRGTTGNRNP